MSNKIIDTIQRDFIEAIILTIDDTIHFNDKYRGVFEIVEDLTPDIYYTDEDTLEELNPKRLPERYIKLEIYSYSLRYRDEEVLVLSQHIRYMVDKDDITEADSEIEIDKDYTSSITLDDIRRVVYE